MSTHLGNAVAPDDLLHRAGADALRVTLLRVAGPQRSLEWRDRHLQQTAGLLDGIYRTYVGASAALHAGAAHGLPSCSRAARTLEDRSRRTARQIAQRIEDYRPNAAIEELMALHRAIDRFAGSRVPSGRLTRADSRVLLETLGDFSAMLAPFAPHLAEECWRRLGRRSPVGHGRWPAFHDAVA